MSNSAFEVENVQSVKISVSNEKLKRELRRVREENRKLKSIISYGNISTLSTLVDQYMDYSRIHLKKIVLEIQMTDYAQGSMEKVHFLRSHEIFFKLHQIELLSLA